VTPHRILLVVPAAKVAAVVSWFVANVGPNSVPADLGPGLSPTGSAPATHAWCCGGWQDGDARAILAKLCQLAGVTPPTLATWNGWSGAQKRTWLKSVQAGILAGYGAWVDLAPNDSTWTDPATALSALGLQAVSSGSLPATTAIDTTTQVSTTTQGSTTTSH
jgi:hypothetical protein